MKLQFGPVIVNIMILAPEIFLWVFSNRVNGQKLACGTIVKMDHILAKLHFEPPELLEITIQPHYF